ncbi:molybdenum cofactor guanylyltransferase [Athalassotoga saccharophila]|uniref:molybdenum cofactor guanylyltransferase n=1 Tax=Athalassotoga saccharophila TaxID=1441386 RepID=UPI00137A8A43|nr:molybdenum cofactor guanylyltransferase [Athalassotoga saccharophila]BBJ27334.1 molybdopterin-guanine dinucleotide biosynthesis protein MobA [Athalassotoga saccharophila]
MNSNSSILVILTGGRSTRFGTDKCTYKIDGLRSVDLIIKNIGSLFKGIIFAGKNENLDGSIPDPKPGLGPISGLYTGLLAGEDVFLVSCDMPFVKKEIVEFILSKKDHDIVCPVVDNAYQVTHAFYSKKIISCLEEEMICYNPSLKSLISKCKDVLLIREEELKRFENYKMSFFNFNFKRDLRP